MRLLMCLVTDREYTVTRATALKDRLVAIFGLMFSNSWQIVELELSRYGMHGPRMIGFEITLRHPKLTSLYTFEVGWQWVRVWRGRSCKGTRIFQVARSNAQGNLPDFDEAATEREQSRVRELLNQGGFADVDVPQVA